MSCDALVAIRRSFGDEDRLIREVVHSRATMALIFSALAFAASFIGLLTFLSPQIAVSDRAFQIVMTAAGFPFSALVLVARSKFGERLPMNLFYALIAVTIVMICLGSWSAQTGPTAISSTAFFVWIGMYIGSFFSLRAVLVTLVWIAACLSVLLDVNGTRTSGSGGIMTFGIVIAATAASYYLSNALARAAATDVLTGLFNRKTIDVVLQREMNRCESNKSPLAVGIVDIDNLKEINDTHGHLAGDASIVSLARLLASRREPGEILARYGGDEFVIVVPGGVLEKVIETFDCLRVSDGGSYSLGVASWEPGDTVDTLLARADRGLYAAKVDGRLRNLDDGGAARHIEGKGRYSEAAARTLETPDLA